MKFAKINNLTLHYQTQGPPTATPLLFANSLGTDLRIWDTVAAQFADNYYIIRYDKPGHGLSDTPTGSYTIHDHAEAVAGLLDQLNITSVIFAGISMGGQIAQDFAIHHPEQVKGLVLCDTAAKLGSADSWNQRIDGIRQKGMASMTDTIIARWFAPSYPEQHPIDYAGYYNMLSRIPDNGYISACKALRDADMRHQVVTIQVPSLVLCGTEDAATTTDIVKSFADSMPNARFEAIDDAGHLPCIEQPTIMSSKIRQFFKDNNL